MIFHTGLQIRMASLLLAVVILVASAPPANAADQAAGESNLVVAYLYNFGKFVEWPAATFPSTDAPIQYCVYGDNTLVPAMEALSAKQVKGHPIQVAHIKRGGSLEACHLLYIDASERLYLRPILNLIRELPILSISEVDGFASAGGIIGLVYVDKKLKFEINKAAAAQAQIAVSSQIMKLAVKLYDKLPE